MPSLPSIVKTWEIDPNRIVGQANEGATIAEWFFRTIEWLSGGGRTTPCIVRGSSDGSTAGMDDVNRITSQAAASAFGVTTHSWVVLEFPGINFGSDTISVPNPLQVLISRINGTVGNIHVVISMSAGFGSANGGTDGNVSTDPTALDQWCSADGTSLIGAGNLPDMRQTICLSSDGSICRLLMSGVTTARGRWMSFETPKNPVPEWERPFLFMFIGTTTTSNPFVAASQEAWSPINGIAIHNALAPYRDMTGIGLRDWSTTAAPSIRQVERFTVLGVKTCVGSGSTTQAPALFTAVHAIDGGINIFDAYLAALGPGSSDKSLFGGYGYWGQLEDFYFVGGGGAVKDSLPSTGEKLWWHLGNAIIPGLGDSATDIIL